jgi:hypothetical protein
MGAMKMVREMKRLSEMRFKGADRWLMVDGRRPSCASCWLLV